MTAVLGVGVNKMDYKLKIARPGTGTRTGTGRNSKTGRTPSRVIVKDKMSHWRPTGSVGQAGDHPALRARRALVCRSWRALTH
jgi:hypothetical protein